MGYKVVVVGATGNVGREMLNILAERQFPVDEIAVLASRRSLRSARTPPRPMRRKRLGRAVW
jgi:aspartate-semialdehyde dehydrogenase